MDKLQATYNDIRSLDDATRSHMYLLFERYYDAVSAEMFERDLQDKSVAILLNDSKGALQGFSTIELIQFETDFGPALAMYSGDTIIDHSHWGDQVLAHAWCYLAGQIKKQRQDLPLYWFLIVKGHRTYRYLPAFTRYYYPNHREETPAQMQAIMDVLAREKFADYYRADAGVLHFPKSQGHLRKKWAETTDALARKPTIAFFLQRNPGHAAGDELVCLTELSESNMRFVSRVAFLEGMNSCQDGVIFDLASLDSATH
jgi:hypothetical protein